jgi:uncharacterized delta-60 repeat protein
VNYQDKSNPLAPRAAGALDPDFGFTGSVPLAVFPEPNLEANQRFYVVGHGSLTNERESWISRYDANGSLDTSFNGGRLNIPSLLVQAGEYAFIVIDAMIFDADGSITCVGDAMANAYDGYYCSSAALRLTSTGELDTTFGSTGNGTAIFGNRELFNDLSSEINPRFASSRRSQKTGGGILFLSRIPSYSDRPALLSASYLVKITPDGSPDTGFYGKGFLKVDPATVGTNWSDYGVDDKGRLTAIGETMSGGQLHGVAVRFTPDGALDPTFGSGGRVMINDQGVQHKLLQLNVSDDGRITVLVTFPEQGDTKLALMRLAEDGTADSTFNNGTACVVDSMAGARWANLQVDSQGRSYVAKSANGGELRPRLYRVAVNGSIDTDFGSNGSVEYSDIETLRLYAIQKRTDLLAAILKSDAPNESFARILGS